MINFIILSIFLPNFQKPPSIPDFFIFTDFVAKWLSKVYYYLMLYNNTAHKNTSKLQKSVNLTCFLNAYFFKKLYKYTNS